MRPALLLGVLAWGLILAGCVSDRNERLAIGTRATASFRTSPGGPPETVDHLVRARRDWDTTVVVLAVDGVVHGQALRTPDRVGRKAKADTAGVFPDARREHSSGSDLKRAVSAWGRAAFELGLMPLRAVGGAMSGWEDWSPRRVWKRRPADRVPTASVPALREDADDRSP